MTTAVITAFTVEYVIFRDDRKHIVNCYIAWVSRPLKGKPVKEIANIQSANSQQLQLSTVFIISHGGGHMKRNLATRKTIMCSKSEIKGAMTL